MIEEIGKEAKIEKKFPNTGKEWSGLRAAEDFCKKYDLTIGQMQRGDPLGVALNCDRIAKWRNIFPEERGLLDGVLKGDFRSGEVVLQLAIVLDEG